MFVQDYTITSLDTIRTYTIGDGNFLFELDELQNAKIANTQEKQDITGKGGRKLNSLKKNKAVVVSGTNGLVSAGLLELQTGSKFEEKESAPINWVDYLAIEGNEAQTQFNPAGTEGNEIGYVYIKNADGTRAETLVQGAEAAEGVFAFDPATKTITFAEGAFEDGTEIEVHYLRKVKGQVLENISDIYSMKCQMYIDATIEDSCNKAFRAQFYIPKADFSGNFDFDMGDNQTVHAFEAESLAGACGSAGKLWTYTIFGTDAEDAE